MYLTLNHAIYSAIEQTDGTFMFLPSWGGPMSTTSYSKLLNAYPHLCCTFGIIPSATLNYASLLFWISKGIMLPRHSWSLQIVAVWNTAARICFNENNPAWLTKLARDSPETRWRITTISNDPVLNARHQYIEANFKKFEKYYPLTNSTPLRTLTKANNPSRRLPHLAQTWSSKFRTGKSGYTQIPAAIYTLEDN
eukprot:1160913-Pelagomonas_calceolata.AAC.9